ARQSCAGMRGKDPRITQASSSKFRSNVDIVAEQFFRSSYQPLPTYIQTNDQPDPGHPRIGKQEPTYRWLRDLYYGLWPYVPYSATHDLLLLSERNAQFSHGVRLYS